MNAIVNIYRNEKCYKNNHNILPIPHGTKTGPEQVCMSQFQKL